MAKEKTKTDLLNELNEGLEKENQELKKRNQELIDEIRQVKSSNSQLEIYKKEKDRAESLQNELLILKKENFELKQQNSFQEQQIKVLVLGLNDVNSSINGLFSTTKYILGLAEEKYNSIFTNIQNNLNKINEVKTEESDN